MTSKLDLGRLLSWTIFALVLILAIVPLAAMVIASVLPTGSLFGTERLQLTFANYQQTFGDASTYRLLMTTLVYALSSISLGLSIAFIIAWLMERTDMPGRHLLYGLMFIPMAIPPFATASGWILLLGPNAGTLNVWLRDWLDMDMARGPFNIYSMWGMVFVTGLAIVPTMWLLLLGLFRNMDPSLEEAAKVSGLGRASVLRYITFPLMQPGILGVLAYYGVVALEIFEIPLAIGLTANISVLSTRIFFLSANNPTALPNYGIAATLGVISMMVALFVIILYLGALRQSSKFTVVSGKGYRPRRIQLGRFKYFGLLAVAVYFVLQVFLPFFVLLWSSLLRYYQPPSIALLPSLSLQNYAHFFQVTEAGKVFGNTVALMLGAATMTTLLAALVAWLVVRKPSRLSRVLNILSFVPIAVPGTVVAVGFLLLSVGTPLYGSIALLIIAGTSRFLPFTTRLFIAAQMQIDKSLEEVAIGSGIGGLTAFVRINIPLLAPSLMNGWLWVATQSLRDFTMPLLLATFATPVMANAIFDIFSLDGPSASAAPIVLWTAASFVLTFSARRWVLSSWVR